MDPDEIFGAAKRRALTPEEAGTLLACFPMFWWDHVLALLGTGLRFGEFAGLRRRRVHLDRAVPVLQVVDVRYQAGRYGSGFKNRPKSDAGFREIPLAPLVVEAIRRQLPPDATTDTLVFTGPGGANGVLRGTRTVLSRDSFHRTFEGAVAKLTDPAATLRPTATRVLRALRAAGAGTVPELVGRLATAGRALAPASVDAALGELEAAGLAVSNRQAPCWSPVVDPRPTGFEHLALRGAHDFRHTFATWLEDAGIPARVIDELMGHEHSQRARHTGGSKIGRRYRETTPEMLGRVVAAVEERLELVLEVAEEQR